MILLKEHMFNILNMLEQYVIMKAMKHVLSYPNKAFSVRGLAKEMEISVGSAKAALDFMGESRIVKNSAIGRSYQYKADLESVFCRQWKVVFNLEELRNSGVMEIKKEGVHSMLLYGSFAKGTNDEKSDVDILAVVHKMPKEKQAQKWKIGLEVNVSWITLDDWKKKAKEDKVFYENVIYDSIVLYGQRPVVV